MDPILGSIQSASNNNEDIMHIATTLLSNTRLSVPVKDLMGRPFKCVPQGDSFSPVPFTTPLRKSFHKHSQRFQQQHQLMFNKDSLWHSAPSFNSKPLITSSILCFLLWLVCCHYCVATVLLATFAKAAVILCRK